MSRGRPGGWGAPSAASGQECRLSPAPRQQQCLLPCSDCRERAQGSQPAARMHACLARMARVRSPRVPAQARRARTSATGWRSACRRPAYRAVRRAPVAGERAGPAPREQVERGTTSGGRAQPRLPAAHHTTRAGGALANLGFGRRRPCPRAGRPISAWPSSPPTRTPRAHRIRRPQRQARRADPVAAQAAVAVSAAARRRRGRARSAHRSALD